MNLYVELLRHSSLMLGKTFITVDLVLLRGDNSFVLVKRGFDPFKGQWALPGGFLDMDETVEEAAAREAREETGLEIEIMDFIGAYSDPKRDPRGRIVSVALLAREVGGKLKAGSDAQDVKSFKSPPENLAFDHGEILKAGMKKFKKNK